jgi:hypothetical protein
MPLRRLVIAGRRLWVSSPAHRALARSISLLRSSGRVFASAASVWALSGGGKGLDRFPNFTHLLPLCFPGVKGC